MNEMAETRERTMGEKKRIGRTIRRSKA